MKSAINMSNGGLLKLTWCFGPFSTSLSHDLLFHIIIDVYRRFQKIAPWTTVNTSATKRSKKNRDNRSLVHFIIEQIINLGWIISSGCWVISFFISLLSLLFFPKKMASYKTVNSSATKRAKEKRFYRSLVYSIIEQIPNFRWIVSSGCIVINFWI